MDIEIKSQPFTKEKLRSIKEELTSGRIRRFAAVVDHQRLKFSYNALIAWQRQALSRQTIQRIKEKEYLSHIYLRKAHRLWPFGLYTMVHAQTQEEMDAYVKELFQLLGRCKFRVLNTLKELKKISFNPYADRLHIPS